MKIKEQHALKLNLASLKNQKTDNVDKAFESFKESIDNHKNTIKINQYSQPITKTISELDLETRGSSCLHKNCAGCKNGTCSGMHMISCPCRNCSVWC